MDLEELSTLASAIESIATVLALIVGGTWAYRRFIRQREDYPHVDFSVDMTFVKEQGQWWIIELVAWLENKGKVQHRIKDFGFDLRGLFPDDPVQSSERYGGQVYFPHEIVKGNWLPEEWEETFIEPGTRTHYSYIARVPREASLVLLHGYFRYGEQKAFHSAEKISSVPSESSASSDKEMK